MQPGRLDKRATFRGRGVRDSQGFEVRGDYVDLFAVWAEFRAASGRAQAEAGSLSDVIEATLVVRDTARTRGLTVAHRVVVDHRDYAIVSVPPSDRSGWLFLKIACTKGSA